MEVAYMGKGFSGFQVQQNALTIQEEVERAFYILHKQKVIFTGSSRTDAGVHALQNYFHFDFEGEINEQFIYKMNAILPAQVVIKDLFPVCDTAHCRFDAVSREYTYNIYRFKNPFLTETAYYYPYKLSFDKLNEAALLIKQKTDFTSFSKKNTQVKSFSCTIYTSEWRMGEELLSYNVKANRFLRGMVRALTATMLLVGRQKITIEEFSKIIDQRDCSLASFAVPAHGLVLKNVDFPLSIYQVL